MKQIYNLFDGVLKLSGEIKDDSRGHLVRLFCQRELEDFGIKNFSIAQENLTLTKKKGSFRGLHFQKPPSHEAKLIRCIKGIVNDFILDIRKFSPTFMQLKSVILDSENYDMIYIPYGFAHGFQTITDDVLMIYLHSDYYDPLLESGINVADPRIGLRLTTNLTDISEKDSTLPFLQNNFDGYLW